MLNPFKDNISQTLAIAERYKRERKDTDNAIKYAYMAAAMSFSPRADVCCMLGELYLEKRNLEWAMFWYEKAYGNTSFSLDETDIDEDYYTIVPMLKLGFINSLMGNNEKALLYFKNVLAVRPDNKIAMDNIEAIEKEKTE